MWEVWGLKETLDSMFSYQLWDNLIKLVAAVGTVGAGIAAYRKYSYEKNRQVYERRLNEVYAPLYRVLAMQETYRKLYLSHVNIDKAPILYTKTINKTIHNVLNGSLIEVYEEVSETDGILTREKFLETLDKTNFGLARPNLLIIISQYELLFHLEEDWKKRNIDDWKKLSKEEQLELDNNPQIKKILREKVEVEKQLVREIVGGYTETVRKLGLGNDYKSIDYFNIK